MPPLHHTDDDLVLGLRAGERRALEAVYAQYHGDVYNLCARVLCDRDEAQDVTQDVFIKAFSRPPAAGEKLNLRAWLYRVATNACYNAIRARNRLSGPGGGELDMLPAAVDEYERARTAALVESSLGQLNERYRVALVLRDLHGLPASELAAVLDVSRPTADVLVHRARASFRAVFSKLAGDKTPAPASLGLVLAPLSVPAALHLLPPLPSPAAAAPAAPPAAHAPGAHVPILPDASSLAGPGAVGLLARLGDVLSGKVALTAAAATLVLGGGLAVERAHESDALDTTAGASAVQAGAAAFVTQEQHEWHDDAWLQYAPHHDHAAEGGHDAEHSGTGHNGAHDGETTATHDGETATHDGGTTATHDAETSTTTGATSTSTGDHTGDATAHDTTSGGDGTETGGDH